MNRPPKHIRAQQTRMRKNQIAHLYHTGILPYLDKLPTNEVPLTIKYSDDYTRDSLRYHWMKHLNKMYRNDPPYLLSFSPTYGGIILNIFYTGSSILPPPPQAYTQAQTHDSPLQPIQRVPTIEESIQSATNTIFESPEHKLKEALRFIENNPDHPDIEVARRAAEELSASAPLCPNSDKPQENALRSPIEEDADCELNEDEQELLDIVTDAEEDPNA